MGGGGKGGGGGGESTVYQSSLPEYARPYYERLMRRGEAESNRPYEAYPGQRLADFTQDTQSGFDLTRDAALNPPTGIDVARGRLEQGTQYETPYDPASFQGGTFDSAAAQQYMSPYLENVLDAQQSRAFQRFNQQQNTRDARAREQGAFGGSRAAIVNQMAQDDLNRQLAEIEAQGYQNAYDTAGSLFQSDQARRLQAEGMTDSANQQFAQFDLAGNQMGLGAAQTLSGLDELQQAMAFQRGDALSQAGLTQQQQSQAELDVGYEDFINQRDFGRQNLQFLSGLLHGVPVNVQQEVITPSPNPLTQAAGLGLGGLGMYRLFGQ